MPHRYNFNRGYGELFRRNGIDLSELLRRSALPEDLFGRRDVLLTREEYYRVIAELERQITDEEVTLRIATEEGIEAMSPPAFAAYCSSNGREFIHRFATYKRLVGPMKIDVMENEDTMCIELRSDGVDATLPPYFVTLTLLFILSVLRKATKTNIVPLAVETRTPRSEGQIVRYLGCAPQTTDRDVLILSAPDLLLPFVSRNDAMWDVIEPELRRRLSEMEIDDTTAARVRSALVELLPAGKTTIESVADKLFLSRRTLQRRLSEERTTFQQQLNSTRLLLAQNYLRTGQHRSDDIAFLLGYEDVASFLRAFNAWTGITVSEYKRRHH